MKKTPYASSLILLLCLLLFSVPAAAVETYVFERMVPGLQQPLYILASDMTADSEGNLYIVNEREVLKINQEGQIITKWGTGYGTADGFSPKAIDRDIDGNIYVVDSGQNIIQKFTEDGQFLSYWGGTGAGDGQFDFFDEEIIIGGGIAIDDSGNIYIADTMNHRIQKFDLNGTFIAKWGSLGSGDYQFDMPAAITVNSQGDVFVLEYGNVRIQKFDSNGTFITRWGSQGTVDGRFNFSDQSGSEGLGIEADKDDFVYVTDVYNRRIQKFDSNGIFVSKWGSLGTGNDQFFSLRGVGSDSNGFIYTLDHSNRRMQKFTSEGQFITKWGMTGGGEGEFIEPIGIGVDSSGNIYVADMGNGRVQKFSANGQFLGQFPDPDSQAGGYIAGITVDGPGNIYIIPLGTDLVQKYNAIGELQAQWGGNGSTEGKFDLRTNRTDLAVDSSNNIYVVDTWNHRIQKFDSNGVFLTEWGSPGIDEEQFNFSQDGFGIAVDPDPNNGFVYVAEYENKRIQKFDLDGTFLRSWGPENGEWGDWVLDGPNAIAVDSNGDVFVSDRSVIKQYTSAGVYVGKYFSEGYAPGQNLGVNDLLITSSRMYVVESQLDRVQIFKKVTPDTSTKAIIVAGGGPFPGNNLWNATQMNANFAYQTLAYQGFTKGTINYLSSDTDLDLDNNGIADDVDGDATSANLQEAITTWAADTDNLLIYLVDHGGAGTFRMSGSETLTASELAGWLNTLQATITGKVIVVYDACESGSFIDALKNPPAGKERIVIASTSPGESAYFISQGSISFSNYFWTQIFNGLNLKDAFDSARDAMGFTTSFQNPLLDDNGNGIGNEAGDGLLGDGSVASSTSIGSGTTVFGEAPTIGGFSLAQTINYTSTALLYAEDVIDANGIAHVWATIRPPNYNQGSSYNSVKNLPSVDLMPVGDDRYEASYDGFNLTGTYNVVIYARDTYGNTSIPEITTVSVGTPLSRKAIIVAGSWQDDQLWPSIENNVSLAYNALSFQGYSDDDIYLLSPEAITDLVVDDAPTIANLNYAITNWAADNTQDLVIYLVGNSGGQKFKVNQTERLGGGDLDDWLDTLQATMTGTVTLVYDASQSGGFLSYLLPPAGSERILIASAAGNESANFLAQGDISFSSFFWRQVLNGASVRNAFIHARKAITFLTDSQTPLLDDNGNGIGNEKTAGSVDGLLARYYSLGVGIMLAGDEPLIGSVSPAYTLTAGVTSADIWAYSVTTTGSIDTVWAVIMPPAAYQDSFADTASVNLVEYSLTSGRYEGNYNGFTTFGTYTVAFYARDTAGNISMPVTTTVIQTEGPDVYEDDDASTSANVIFVDDIRPQIHNFYDAGDEDWVRFHAIPGVIYEIAATNPGIAADVDMELFAAPGGAVIYSSVDGLFGELETMTWSAPTDSSYTDGIYYIKITNGVTGTPGANTEYDLAVFRPTAPDLGIIQGIIHSGLDLSAISGAIITSTNLVGSAISLIDGVFQLSLEPGTANLASIFPGFVAADTQVEVVAGRTARVELAILPAGMGDLDGDLDADLADAILALQIVTGNAPAYTIAVGSDISSDGRIGIAEVLYILQEVSGLRQ